MSKPRIVILDGGTLNPGDNPWTGLEACGAVESYARSAPDEIRARLHRAEIAIVNKVRLTRDVFAACPELRLVAVTATGHDCVDGVAARDHGIAVCNVPTYGTDSVAQYTFALLLELCHAVGMHDAAVRAGQWQASGAFSFWRTPQLELARLTLGILGWGRIGQRVAEIGRALGMSILVTSSQSQPAPGAEPSSFVSLHELAARADIVTCHCSLTERTRGIISRDFLARMKPSAFLINTARGALIDETALVEALHAGRLAGAALDVVSVEPIPADHPLLTTPRCLLTPHMAWTTGAARQRLTRTTVENIRNFLAGRPQNVVNGWTG